MSNLFPNYPDGLINPVKGKGCWIWDDKGDAYLDFTSGIGVCQLGHTPDMVKEEVKNQLDQLWHTSNLFTIEPQGKLAETLVELSGLDYVFFANSGAEANEAAIKLARRYQQTIRGNERYEVITFEQSFHGRTLATLTATGQKKVKEGFLPLPEGFLSVPYGDIDALKQVISDKTAAILLEVIQGEGGIIEANQLWLQEVERLAKEQDILLMIDEVQTGIGRTGEWFGYQHYGIQPDVITLAKGLGNGFPIGAILGVEKTKEAFSLGSHGSTFGGNFIVTTAANATIEALKEGRVLQNAKELGIALRTELEGRLAKYPEFIEVRGKGLMIGVEWKKPVPELVKVAKDNGLLVLTAGTNVLRLLPPLNITKEEIEEGLERLFVSIDTWLNETVSCK